jgi:hypothetical protein
MARRWWWKLPIAGASALLAFVSLGEIGLRIWKPPGVRLFEGAFSGGPGERMVKIDRRFEVHPEHDIFQLDDELGYRPVPGGKGYGPHGCKWNEYAAEQPSGKKRLLFIGDSVTDRHKIVDALAERLGQDFEYWNAGIPGYATEQEFLYYRDYLGAVQAEHVILTFHLNDFETTPITFEVEGELVSVHSRIGHTSPNVWLLANSYIYRFGWSWMVSRTGVERAQGLEQEVQRGLADLAQAVRARGAEFSVLILPWLQQPDQWPAPKPAHHRLVVESLQDLGVRHWTFLETLERALSLGVPIHQAKRDPQHPSLEFARLMAEDLMAGGFEP